MQAREDGPNSQAQSPFYRLNSSPEIIRLAVMIYVR
jgi:hypothetical protein